MSEYACTACGGTASSEYPCRCCGELGYHGGRDEECMPAILKEHDWKIEGPTGKAGPQYYWICRTCGASGGPSFLPWEQLTVKKPRWAPFLSGTPLQPVSEDCDEAKKQIDEFIAKYPVWKEYVDKARDIK